MYKQLIASLEYFVEAATGSAMDPGLAELEHARDLIAKAKVRAGRMGRPVVQCDALVAPRLVRLISFHNEVATFRVDIGARRRDKKRCRRFFTLVYSFMTNDGGVEWVANKDLAKLESGPYGLVWTEERQAEIVKLVEDELIRQGL